MRTPLRVLPVTPILHDVVDRKLERPVLLEDIDDLVLRLIALAALPVAIGPFGHHLGLTGEVAIAGDHVVQVVAADEIVIDGVRHIGMQRQFVALLVGQRIDVEETQITAFRNPLRVEGDGHAHLHRQVEIAIPALPTLAPAVHDQLAVDGELEIAADEEAEFVHAGLAGFDLAVPYDLTVPDVLHHSRPIGLVGNELIVRIALVALQLQGLAVVIARGQAALVAVCIVKRQLFRHRLVFRRIAEAGDRVIVPQHAVISGRHDHRHGDVHVVLGKDDVLAVVVHLTVLVLAQSVEAFVGAAVELLADAVEILAVHFDRREFPAVIAIEHDLAARIEEFHLAAGERNLGRCLGGCQGELVALGRNVEPYASGRLGDHHQACRQIDSVGRRRRHADDAVGYDLETDLASLAAGRRDDHAVRGLLPVGGRGHLFRLGREIGPHVRRRARDIRRNV